MSRTDTIEREIAPLRQALTVHPLYDRLSELADVKVFMESHVYAVWDFMSLLKALQRHLTCVDLPWKPAPNAKLARFINEIVWGEESDVNEHGTPRSHYEMYLDAMDEVGADTERVSALLAKVNGLEDIDRQLQEADLLPAERDFLRFTFDVIRTGEPHKIASAFTFGREDLIPDMFIAIVQQSKGGKSAFPKLTYYLERHIEIDGDEHGPLSLEMISELCGDDDRKWDEALTVAREALKCRIALWDAIAEKIGLESTAG